MQKTTNITDLKAAISILELEHAEKLFILKDDFRKTIDGFRNQSLFKNLIGNVVGSPFMADKILGPSLGVVAGYFSKKIIVGKSTNKLRLLLGTVAQYGVTSLVSRNTSVISKYGTHLFQFISHSRKKEEKR